MSPLTVLAACLVALAALESAAALRCYSCDSQNDYSCDDPFRMRNAFALIECDQRGQGPAAYPGQQPYGQQPYYHGYPICKKIKQRTVDGRSMVIRSCGWVDANDGGRSACQQLGSAGYIHQEYCSICNSEACNSAPRPNVPLAAIFAAPLVAVAAWMRR